ncbi:hypothetical protein BGY98DRAFT_32111 [Russula aff. rugulosa BPL654]|nr:hypothetical protein BGY98DRAFT_32111 [Russula aff. rugulosa BPL654]
MVVDDDDEDVAEVVESKSKRRRKGAPAVPVTNGKAKGKGKATSTVNGHKNDADLVIIDELDDEEPPVVKPPSPTKKGKTRAGSSLVEEEGEILEGTVGGTKSASSPELERMRAERDLYKTKSEELSESMLQLIKARNTEPEEELAAMKVQYDAATSAKEELIKELTVQIARLNPMLKEGRDSTVHFLTREAADEEKRILEERLEKAKETLKQKDAVIKDKDARIAALNEQLETTQADLKAEIAHSQTLQNKSITKGLRETPRSGRTAQETLINDPKHGVTIRLYEDLTNLIVLSAKIQESPYAYLGQFEEITYKCIFSHMNTASLSFLLTSMYQPPPASAPGHSPSRPKTKEDLQRMVRYTPLELERSRRNIYRSWTSSRIPSHSVMIKWSSS